jgi:hypothetical protein
MFPNVRLMVAATFASVLALIFGLGMFAAFRVSHEPLARLPPASTPPLLRLADNTTISSVAASGEAFDRRFQVSLPPGPAPTTALPEPERRDDSRTAVRETDSPQDLHSQDLRSAAPGETSATAEPAPATSAAGSPAAAPMVPRDDASAADAARTSSLPQPEQLPATTDNGPVAPAASAAPDEMSAATDPKASDTKASDTKTSNTKTDAGSATTPAIAAAEPLAEPQTEALTEPLANPPLPPLRPKQETQKNNATSGSAARAARARVDASKAKLARIAARLRYARRVAAGYGQTAEQNSGVAQSGFAQQDYQTPPDGLPAARRLVRIPRTRIAARRTRTSAPAGTGGPFVPVPPR